MSSPQDADQIATGLAQIAAFVRMADWREAEPLGLTPTQRTAATRP